MAQTERKSAEVDADVRASLALRTAEYENTTRVRNPLLASDLARVWVSTHEYLAAKKPALSSWAYETPSRGRELSYTFDGQRDGVYVQLRIARIPIGEAKEPMDQYFRAASPYVRINLDGMAARLPTLHAKGEHVTIAEPAVECRLLESTEELLCKRDTGEFILWSFLSAQNG